ncbi:MAG: hypothetical protein COB17_05920 [Sulfurimonas sp.]|nr:MAG: hypothetical protein COB17_05920 [Sulfurimonas sp.]
MILDNITQDRDARALVMTASYNTGDFNLFYAYGDFYGSADSSGISEHIYEQNIGFDYKYKQNYTVSAIYTIQDDKYNTGVNNGDWTNFRVLVLYNF